MRPRSTLGLISGGTGIAPMIQLIQAIRSNPEDRTKVVLLAAFRCESEILLRPLVDNLKSDQVKVIYSLSEPTSPEWADARGRIDRGLIERYMPKPADENIHICVCGTRELVANIAGKKGFQGDQGELGGMLKLMGYNEDQVFKF